MSDFLAKSMCGFLLTEKEADMVENGYTEDDRRIVIPDSLVMESLGGYDPATYCIAFRNSIKSSGYMKPIHFLNFEMTSRDLETIQKFARVYLGREVKDEIRWYVGLYIS